MDVDARAWRTEGTRPPPSSQGGPGPLHLSSGTFTNLNLTFALGLRLYQALGYRDKEDPRDLRAKPGMSRKEQPAWDTREGFLEVGPFYLGFGR